MTNVETMTRHPLAVVRRPQLRTVFGITFGDTRLWQLVKAGKFPKPIHLAEGGRHTAWLAHEIEEYLSARVAARDAEAAAETAETAEA